MIFVGAVWPQAALSASDLDLSECAYPDPPEIPNGSGASADAMADSGQAVRDYVADVQVELGCLVDVEKGLGEEITDEQSQALVDTYNRGVDLINLVADRYNEQVCLYKVQTGEETAESCESEE